MLQGILAFLMIASCILYKHLELTTGEVVFRLKNSAINYRFLMAIQAILPTFLKGRINSIA